MDREVFSDLLFVGLSNVAATHQSPHSPTDAKGYRVAAASGSSAPLHQSVLAVDDDEDRPAHQGHRGALQDAARRRGR